MARDETRIISGDEARRLTPSGERIIENPAVLDDAVPRNTEGLPQTPGVVQNTPVSDGSTPAQRALQSQRLAENALSRTPGEGDQGRSPDARRSPDEVDTGSSSFSPEEADARREGDPSAAREAAPARPGFPHYFVEQKHQVYYHDAIVYIEGEDVSDYLLGSISVTYGLGSSPNKCDITLDNAGHKFTLTPENLQESSFRTPETIRGRGSAFDYSELPKSNIFGRKSNPSYNPVDRRSGGRRFPLHHWSSVFHKNDSVRVWIHNPASDRDEWLPVFAGYIISKPINEDYITGENRISISCADIRYNMQKMRVNTNSVLAILPGQQATGAADPTNRAPFTGLPIFRPQSNRQFDRSFFTDLTISNRFTNPWSAFSFVRLVAALTFLPGSPQRLGEAGTTRSLEQINSDRRNQAERLGRQISPLHQRVLAGETLSTSEQETYDRLTQQIQQLQTSVDSAISGQVTDLAVEDETERAVESSSNPASTPESPPDSDSDAPASFAGGRLDYRTAPTRGAGRIGRLRAGVFPFNRSLPGEVREPFLHTSSIYPTNNPTTVEGRRVIQGWWQNWYNLCLFSSPRRKNSSTSSFEVERDGATVVTVGDGPLDLAVNNRRYWTEDEVNAAGAQTRREGLWQVDNQAVHMIVPVRDRAMGDIIFTVGIIGNSNVATNQNWTTRLQLLTDACDTVDYRFWVSGSGDLIFEFAQYDFDPRDYGAYEEVLTLDDHLLSESFDDEAGEIVTAVVANGSYVGLENVSEQNLQQYIPVSVGVWSPNLASRHGLNVAPRHFAQITDPRRLEQLATLEFQKLLAAADEYQVSLAFRPWLVLNKPIYNAYRNRYALIDGIRWTLPVTAGSVAGQQSPSCNLTLNYSRSIDELGIPRYITGGPSHPMFFGSLRGGQPVGSITSRIARRVREFSAAVNDLRTQDQPITSADLQELRDRYNALLPRSQASFNVIDAALTPADVDSRAEGVQSDTAASVQALSSLTNDTLDNSGSLSERELRQRLQQIEESADSARSAAEQEGQQERADQTPIGTAPDLNVTGVRTTLTEADRPERPRAGPPVEEEPCFPGDPTMFSAPLGRQSLSVVPRFSEWSRRLLRDVGARRRREILTAFGRGEVEDPFANTSAPVGVFQERGDFPRVITSGFGSRRAGGITWHSGVDLPAALGDPCYAVADGIVITVSRGGPSGNGCGLLHRGGFVTFYRHLGTVLVEIGDEVKRNQQIAEIGQSRREASPMQIAETHLHFETAVVRNSPVWNQFVGSNQRFEVITASRRNTIVSQVTQSQIESLPDRVQRALRSAEASRGQRGRRRALLNLFATGRDLGSSRVIDAVGGPRISISTISAEVRDRFDLQFLRTRSGEGFAVPRFFLFYNPACVDGDPFSAPEQRITRSRDKGSLTTQREYFSEFGLKGIPAVTQWKLPSGSRQLVPVPDIPAGATGRRLRRAERERAAALRENSRRQRRIDEIQARLERQISLYSDAVPPEDCPPDRYEGTTPRQPGEPLTDRRRISRQEARRAYRSRE